MADRVKYFVLGLLFLVVAAVIAYDSWNSTPEDVEQVATRGDADGDSERGESVDVTTDGGDYRHESSRAFDPELRVPHNNRSDDGAGLDVGDRTGPDRVNSHGASSHGAGLDRTTSDRAADRDGAERLGGSADSEFALPDDQSTDLRRDPSVAERGEGNASRGSRDTEGSTTGRAARGNRRDGNAARSAAPAREVVHIVRANENLEKIALKYYGTRRGIAWIAAANRLRNPDVIFEKQRLVIPARKESRPNARGNETTRRPRGNRGTARKSGIPDRYTVKPGEDLYDICRRYYGRKGEGARVSRIMDLNGLYSARVKAGTILRLPN